MFSNLIKVISTFVGGATIIGTPALLTQSFNAGENAVEVSNQESQDGCKILVESQSENKAISVCKKGSSLEFLFLKNKNELEQTQSIVSFQNTIWKGGNVYEWPFIITSSTNSEQSRETINVSGASEPKLKQLVASNLTTCKIVGSWQALQCHPSSQEDMGNITTFFRINFVTYR